MTAETQIVRELDLRGYICPIPLVKIHQAIKEIEIGDVISGVATDPGVVTEIPAWCENSGNEVLKLERTDAQSFVFQVRRNR